MNMKDHVKIVAVLRIAMGALMLLIASVVFVAVVGGGLLSGDQDAMVITGMVGTVVGGFLAVLAIPGIVAGVGLLRFKPWARYLTLVLAFFDLFAVPVGTVLGIYTFWVLLQEQVVQLFS